MRIMVLLVVMLGTLVGCDDKAESPASTASPAAIDNSREREDAAMRKFLNREGARVRSVEEIRAAQRAKSHDQ